jgi:eukaryotic-like serine/threonine-protein kinase
LTLRSLVVGLFQYLLLGAALLVTAGLAALITMRVVLLSQEVSVPALVGKRVPEAGEIASRADLQLRVEGKRHDPQVPPDTILAQEPEAGSTLKSRRSIRVWLSLGPKLVDVPDVVGEGLRTARVTLEQAEVQVARVVQVHNSAPTGTILVQSPPAGDTRDVGNGASLLVSLGPRPLAFVMPDLIGRSSGGVVPGLQAAGLRIGQLRERPYPGALPGTILRQTPTAGSRVTPEVPIDLDVSREQE